MALGLGAMAWVTFLALRGERAELLAQAQTRVEERVRLSLWRMDSTMALFLAPETARPWDQFETFHREQGRLAPSPMLVLDDTMVLLRFQIAADGTFTAPLVPAKPWAELARKAVEDPRRLEQAKARLGTVRAMMSLASVREALKARGAVLITLEEMRELRSRSRRSSLGMSSPFAVHLGVWTAFWVGDQLYLGRQVWVGERELLQVTWLDWSGVKEVLESTYRDLLPQGELVPVKEGEVLAKDRRMGSLPLRLVPGQLPALGPRSRVPAWAALALGWAFALAGAVSVGLVLRRALDLGERRGIFASAVSHELRTPLTTFRLYTELLAKGMVTDPDEARSLLETLLAEANRLDHLVKNVLAYARLESGRDSRWEKVQLASLLEGLRVRLEGRALEAGLDLELRVPDALGTRELLTDPLIIEQILLNLVDNAAKYAVGGQDPRLHLSASEHRGRLRLHLQDHGPGIDPADRAHLFHPFHKSAQKAARTAPGVGLGLALCRNLARSLGGDLVLDATVPGGAAFVLSLPLA
jgi:signal transduction histidine kinase